jgi:hypothetical protein
MFGTQSAARLTKGAVRAATGATAGKLAARNTLDYVGADGVRRVRLHSTDVLTFPARGGYIIDTGGWNTPTTRDRINAALPGGARVYTRDGGLYLRHCGVEWAFRERIEVGPRGRIQPDIRATARDREAKMIDAFMAKWKTKGLPPVSKSGGDPWVFTTGWVDREVMLDWVRTRYVTRRLYVLAMGYHGLTAFGVALYTQDADAKGGKLSKLELSRIRRYIRICLGH